jgi:hypothetical protein
MYKSMVALTFLTILPGCAGTARGPEAAAEECKMVDHDATDSHIKVQRECAPTTGSARPQQTGNR